MDANIGGLYLWSWILIIFAVGAIYFLFNSWWETRQAQQKCGGNRILCLMHTIGGQAYWKWCLDEKGELVPADMKGYDKAAKDLASSAIGKIKAEKQEFGWYFVLPDHVFNLPYPLGSKHPRATARIIEYVENFPAPRVTTNLATWNKDQYEAVTSAMAAAAKDTGDIRAIISEAAGIEEKLMGLLEIPNQIKSGKLYITVGEGALILYFVFTMQGNISKIATQLGVAILNFFGVTI
jgi:hypothetical protein